MLRSYSRIVGAIWVAWGAYELVAPVLQGRVLPINVTAIAAVALGVGLLRHSVQSWRLSVLMGGLLAGLWLFSLTGLPVKWGWVRVSYNSFAAYIVFGLLLFVAPVIALAFDRPSKWRTSSGGEGPVTAN